MYRMKAVKEGLVILSINLRVLVCVFDLLAQGIQLKDGKDPATGERITTWEVKR